MSYNGFSNRETFSLCLWLDNEYELYFRVQEAIKSGSLETTSALEKLVGSIIDETAGSQGIEHDLFLCAVSRINWQEALEHLRAE